MGLRMAERKARKKVGGWGRLWDAGQAVKTGYRTVVLTVLLMGVPRAAWMVEMRVELPVDQTAVLWDLLRAAMTDAHAVVKREMLKVALMGSMRVATRVEATAQPRGY